MSAERQIQRRSIGVVFSDGGLLALSALRPEGAASYGDEVLAAIELTWG